jgi:Flp pilus assembly pilin Flp
VRCIAGRNQLVFVRALLDDGGQGLAEYALIVGFIAVLCVSAAAFLGSRVVAEYDSVSTVYP